MRGAVLLSACYAGNFCWCLQNPRLELLHTWSLALEEHFYLVWPFLLWALLRLRLPRFALALVVILGITGSGLARVALARCWHPCAGGMLLPGRADGLLAGCLVAFLRCWGWLPVAGWPHRLLQLSAGAAAAFLLWLGQASAQWSPANLQGGFTLMALSAALVIAALVSAPPRYVVLLLSGRPLVWTGRVSYGLYLWHWPILLMVARLGRRWLNNPPASLALMAAVVCLSFLVTALAYYAVERPVLNLKQRFRKNDEVRAPVAVAARLAA
jgi:peptidoglycan/LPS O-acetylase OafA/YrhL